jgi:hypothetical protein
MQCSMCSNDIPEERVEMGYGHCIDCARANPVLSRPQFGVLGVHKSTPIVVSVDSPEWQAHVTFMRR